MSGRKAFMEWLSESIVVADGAVGTALISRGVSPFRCMEELNISHPDTIFALHREYVHAGARILTTNTFKANRLHLRSFKLESKVAEINARGVEIARRAAHGAPVWIGASMGPLKVMLKPYGDFEEEEARDICREQVLALAEAEPDCFLLETQQSVLEATFFLDACKKTAPDIPVLASLTFGQDGKTFFGDTPVEGCRSLAQNGADVVGLNCSLGPADALPLVEEIAKHVNHPLVVMPNGGYPTEVDGAILYLSNPDYVADYARRFVDLGVNIVGGCCGTTPETIRAIATRVKGCRPLSRNVVDGGRLVVEEPPVPKVARRQPAGGFFQKLGNSFVVTCEIDPPKGPDAGPSVEMARTLKHAGADAVNIADNPMARVRVAPLALAHFIQEETGLSTILHMTCRDRNLLGLQSELLGAGLLGMEGILALGGDPASLGDIPAATSVNDVNAEGLVRVIASLNRGLDFSDNATGTPTHFVIGVGVNLDPENLDREVDKLKAKLDAGATFALTQPIFDPSVAERFLDRVADLAVFILPGILPLSSLKQALYLKHEVPGMTIPDPLIKGLQGFERREDQSAYGIERAMEVLIGLRIIAPGAYLTSGGRKRSMLDQVLRALSG